ncbi:Cysteine-rich with EGF-like domain protein 2 [Homalodisca vitripennis]|nr:Cysteine-rich with EGF-like domain protein 2 [Homalodisca vitripennis]
MKMESFKVWSFINALLVIFFTGTKCQDNNTDITDIEVSKEKLCKACTLFTDYFFKGMELTKRDNFGGGNAAWEEENLGSYATSEVRFVDILEKLCDNAKEKGACLEMSYLWEDYLEFWWFHGREETPNLTQYLCVKTLKYCNPEVCPLGYSWNKHSGCEVINETLAVSSPCQHNEYYIETGGSFHCRPCHPSCVSCHGEGSDNCKEYHKYEEHSFKNDRFELEDTTLIYDNNFVFNLFVGLCISIIVTIIFKFFI